MTLADLPDDVLTKIAELVEPEDIPNLRLANKMWCRVVRQVNVIMHPQQELTGPQLTALCTSFQRITQLTISEDFTLSNSSLRALKGLSQSLIELRITDCSWLSWAGVANLAPLTLLETLDLSNSHALLELPGENSSLEYLPEMLLGFLVA